MVITPAPKRTKSGNWYITCPICDKVISGETYWQVLQLYAAHKARHELGHWWIGEVD